MQPTLASTNCAAVFAAGDVAAVLEHPRPKAGVFAVRQGPPLAANLRRQLLGQPLQPFTPQSSFLGLIGTGDGGCVASRGALAYEARLGLRLGLRSGLGLGSANPNPNPNPNPDPDPDPNPKQVREALRFIDTDGSGTIDREVRVRLI